MPVTLADVVLSGVTRVEGSGGWNAPSKRTEAGYEYDSYVKSEPLEAQIEAWVNDDELRQLQGLRESSDPIPASVDNAALDLAKLDDLQVTREGRINSHQKVIVRISEVRQARLGATEISISTPSGDMGTAASESSSSVTYPEDDDSGTADETTNGNGIVETLSNVREDLAEVL